MSEKDLKKELAEVKKVRDELNEAGKKLMETNKGLSAELDRANEIISEKSEEIKVLSQELAIAKKGASEVKESSVIMNIKDLKKDKSYVTGPKGIGYVEA